MIRLGSLVDDFKKYLRNAKAEVACIVAGLAIAGFATYYLARKLYEKLRGS